MADAVASAVEGTHIIRLCRWCSGKLWLAGLDLLLRLLLLPLYLLLAVLLRRHARMLWCWTWGAHMLLAQLLGWHAWVLIPRTWTRRAI